MASQAPTSSDGPPNKLSGSCLCGRSKYTLSEPPVASWLCHCKSCQKSTGTAFAASHMVWNRTFTLDESSKPYISSYADNDNSSGVPNVRHFCKECGTPLFVDKPGLDRMVVSRSSLDGEDGEGLPPAIEFWCKRKLPWLEISGIKDKRWQQDPAQKPVAASDE